MMKTLVLISSLAFLGVVAAFPRTPLLEEQPMVALYVIPQDEMTRLQKYYLPIVLNGPESHLEKIPRDEDMALSLENEYEQRDGDGHPSEEPAFGARSRRSTQPGGGPSIPQGGQGAGSSDRGQVDVSVSRSEGGGRRVEATGEGNVWQSRDGRGRVDVHGHYSRDYGGRHGTGRPNYGGGIRYSHRF